MATLPGITRPWEIYLVHHTHVDIGYTAPQQVLFRRHAEFIAQALDCIAETDGYPEEARFRWTCEVSWTVKNFLARCPERAEEFFRRVREGRIEVTGIYLQLTDLFSESLLGNALDYAVDLCRHVPECRPACREHRPGHAVLRANRVDLAADQRPLRSPVHDPNSGCGAQTLGVGWFQDFVSEASPAAMSYVQAKSSCGARAVSTR